VGLAKFSVDTNHPVQFVFDTEPRAPLTLKIERRDGATVWMFAALLDDNIDHALKTMHVAEPSHLFPLEVLQKGK